MGVGVGVCDTLCVFLYHRTIETMPDGGEVGLDWGVTEKEKELPRDSPLLLILPGIAGKGHHTLIQ